MELTSYFFTNSDLVNAVINGGKTSICIILYFSTAFNIPSKSNLYINTNVSPIAIALTIIKNPNT